MTEGLSFTEKLANIASTSKINKASQVFESFVNIHSIDDFTKAAHRGEGEMKIGSTKDLEICKLLEWYGRNRADHIARVDYLFGKPGCDIYYQWMKN